VSPLEGTVETWSGRNGLKKLSAKAVRTVPRRPVRNIAAVAMHGSSPIAMRDREIVRMILLLLREFFGFEDGS
jgi:hypothetical protein